MTELNSEQQFEQGRGAVFAHVAQKLDAGEQAFGQQSVEHSLGYQEMESVNPLPSDYKDAEITTTQLEDAAAALQKSRDEALGKPPGEVVREYKTETLDGKKLDESLTVSAEQAAADLTAARDREANTAEVDESAELGRLIDQMRSGVMPEPQRPVAEPVEQQPQPQPIQHASEQERMARVLQENPQLLAEVQQVIEQEQAKAQYAQQQYAAGLARNAEMAQFHLLANYPEINGISDVTQMAGALHAIRQQNPARAAEITEGIARTRQLVEESQRVAQWQQQQNQARAQQWVNQYEANMREQFAQHDRAYDEWSRNQGVSKDQQEQIKQEVLDEFARQGWSKEAIAREYNTNAAMRSFSGQRQLHEAALYRIQQRTMANVRRTKLDRTPPHVQRPGSPVHYDRGADYDHFERQQFKRIDSKPGTDAHKAGAAIIAARRRAKGGQW